MGPTGHECHYCKQWIEAGEAHDCWTTTEAALTADLSEDLKDAWERLRETAAAFGDQRIYASGTAIMFSRKSCYFFVRPRKKDLQVVIFLGRTVKSPLVRRVERKSKRKLAHIVHVTHRDEVEAPLTDWLEEAYHLQDDGTGIAKIAKISKTATAARKTRKATSRGTTASAVTAKTTRKKAKRSTRRTS